MTVFRKPAWISGTRRPVSSARYYLGSILTLLTRLENPGRIAASLLARPPRPSFPVHLRDGSVFYSRTFLDLWTIKEVCLDRDYERGTVPVEDGWTVIDIGAGLGEFAVGVGRRCPRALVHAYEPLPDSFSLLRRNVSENRLRNVVPFSEAVAGTAGEVTLATETGLGAHAQAARPEIGPGAPVRGRAITLANALDRLPSGHCDFLKLDCEGSEFKILLGADEAALGRLRHLALEFHDSVTSHDHFELVRFLEAKNFRVATRRNPVHRKIGFLFASSLAPRESRTATEARSRPRGAEISAS